MPKSKFKITAQIVAYRSITVSADDELAAVEKAAQRLERAGLETVGAFRFERIAE